MSEQQQRDAEPVASVEVVYEIHHDGFGCDWRVRVKLADTTLMSARYQQQAAEEVAERLRAALCPRPPLDRAALREPIIDVPLADFEYPLIARRTGRKANQAGVRAGRRPHPQPDRRRRPVTDEKHEYAAHFWEMNEWDWCWLGDRERGERLHHVVSLEPDMDRAVYGGTGTTSCGRRGTVGIAGLLSRLGMERCRQCCKALGYPQGIGAPKNDPACRSLLEARVRP